jgi:TatD DNase family protein
LYMKFSFIDIHSHVHGIEYDTDRAEVLTELAALGGATITIGTDYYESQQAMELAESYQHVYFCAGIHPVDNRAELYDAERLRSIASHPKCLGIGECGLDYYWPSEYNWDSGEEAEKARQRELFVKQIELAIELDLPLMIHGRPSKNNLGVQLLNMDAYVDILEILNEYKHKHGDTVRGNIHFFVGTATIAKQFMELGLTMSFTGVITFTHDYDEVIRFLPLASIQAETDSPYVSPKPYRGKRNSPVHVREVIAKIAELKGIEAEEVRAALLENAKRVWGIE